MAEAAPGMSEDQTSKGTGKTGYGRPPRATQFQKGRSGNPRGRPRGRDISIPYDIVLGQMVTIREDGRERRVTAAEAFLLQLTQKGLAGDSAAARVLLAAIEAARSQRPVESVTAIMRVVFVTMGIGCVLRELGMAVKTNRQSEQNARWWLKAWIVEAALARFGDRRLSLAEQREVWNATRKPESVRWPKWWTERG